MNWKKVLLICNLLLILSSVSCIAALKIDTVSSLQRCEQQSEKIEFLESTVKELKKELQESNDEINKLNKIIEEETN